MIAAAEVREEITDVLCKQQVGPSNSILEELVAQDRLIEVNAHTVNHRYELP